ncbi:VCBS repeat-containing protein [Dokdonella soli]|uniref:FG-GAP-like repeat-containing protein n=1 Tax=Dokdonella soli TaxID=529810 RepID=A0ABN1IE03_9GAMM
MQAMKCRKQVSGDQARSASVPWRASVLGCALAGASASVSAQIAFQAQLAIATGPAPIAIAVADFNGDGKLDLAVAMKGNDRVYLYSGNGDGTFSFAVSYPVGSQPMAIVAADFNHDGKLDLATANAVSGNVSILLGNGNGTFQTAVAYAAGDTPVSIAADTFNPDGYVDLVVANGGNVCAPPLAPCGTVSLLRNNGDGTFHTGTTLYPQFLPSRVTTGSFHGSDSDIVVTSYGSNAFLTYLGDGGGAFPTVRGPFATSGAYAVVVADFNGDGKSDLALPRFNLGDVSLQLGNGDGTFLAAGIFSEGAVGGGAGSAAIGDFDGDGFPDLAVANVNDGSIAVLRDRTVGNGGFWGALTFTGGLSQPIAIAVGDFNRDGKPDFIVVNNAGDNLTVFLNTSIPVDRIFANGFE